MEINGRCIMRRNSTRAFTLIELLIVIAIIAILAGATTAVVSHISALKKKAYAQGRITALKGVIESFKADHNQPPWALPSAPGGIYEPPFGEVAKNLNPSNSSLPGMATVNTMHKEYDTFGGKKPYKETDAAGRVIDPYGNEYVVRWDRDRNFIVVISPGPDNTIDTADDIRSDN